MFNKNGYNKNVNVAVPVQSVEEIDRISTKFAERLLQWLGLTDRQLNKISEGSYLKKDAPPHDKERCFACQAGECDEID